MANEIRKQISEEIKIANSFALSVDETKDVSKVEQISIVVRYLYESQVYESFIGFSPAYKLTADGLYTKILEYLALCKIDKQLCVAQCYDGAAVMSECKNGVQKKISK